MNKNNIFKFINYISENNNYYIKGYQHKEDISEINTFDNLVIFLEKIFKEKIKIYDLAYDEPFLKFRTTSFTDKNILISYTIYKNTVSVNGDFIIKNNDIVEIPFKLDIVKGVFDCRGTKLSDFKNFPNFVNKNINFLNTLIKQEELVNFYTEGYQYIYCDFNVTGDKEKFIDLIELEKVRYEYKELSNNILISNNNKIKKI